MEKSRKSFLSLIENNMYLSGLGRYFNDKTAKEVSNSDSLFKTLEYLEKSISSADVAIRTIVAAVSGALIGAVLTLLIKLQI
jgi:hypothetical protein